MSVGIEPDASLGLESQSLAILSVSAEIGAFFYPLLANFTELALPIISSAY
jgi:hypothetical protein